MKKDDILDAVLDELKEQGIATTIAQGGKHVQVRWASRLGEPRFVTLPRSPSTNMHSVQNARHQVRQILRTDGMLPEITKPPPLRPLPLTRYDQLERDLKELNMRIARVEQLLKEQTI